MSSAQIDRPAPIVASPADKPATVSVVIVSWNTRDLLANCLASLDTDLQALAAVDVAVVDNASADGSADMVRSRFPWVGLTVNSANLGFARANNQAIRASRGRYLLLLNPDAFVHAGAISTLERFLDEHPHVGAGPARILNSDGTLQTSCYPAPSLARELWRLFHLDALRPYGEYRMQDWDVEHDRPADTLLGACVMLRREALGQVGLFDERFFMYSEEVDLCARLRKHGWQVFWVPRAVVTHYGGESTRQVASAMFLNLYRGKVLYFRKHHGRLAARVYKFVLATAVGARFFLGPAALVERKHMRERHVTLLRQYWRLLRELPGM